MQIDSLEGDDNCLCVFTNALVFNENNPLSKSLFLDRNENSYVTPYEVFTQGGGVLPIATLVFRDFDFSMPEELFRYNIGDSILIVLLIGIELRRFIFLIFKLINMYSFE